MKFPCYLTPPKTSEFLKLYAPHNPYMLLVYKKEDMTLHELPILPHAGDCRHQATYLFWSPYFACDHFPGGVLTRRQTDARSFFRGRNVTSFTYCFCCSCFISIMIEVSVFYPCNTLTDHWNSVILDYPLSPVELTAETNLTHVTMVRFAILSAKRIERYYCSCNNLEFRTLGDVFFYESALASSV